MACSAERGASPKWHICFQMIITRIPMSSDDSGSCVGSVRWYGSTIWLVIKVAPYCHHSIVGCSLTASFLAICYHQTDAEKTKMMPNVSDLCQCARCNETPSERGWILLLLWTFFKSLTSVDVDDENSCFFFCSFSEPLPSPMVVNTMVEVIKNLSICR